MGGSSLTSFPNKKERKHYKIIIIMNDYRSGYFRVMTITLESSNLDH